ncbi:MAG: HYR domain-containing protein [Lewinellaceae bacterium]|nr:HYR domain-containing protein [Lewinellaceae bacterium]
MSLLGAAPGGGTFSGTGVSGTSYTAAGGTTNTVTYTYVNGDGCSSSCTFDVIVGATPTLTLTAEMPANATCGDLVDVTFKVSNAFTDISSLQFSVEWDETKLMYVSPATTLEIGGLGGDPIIGDLDALSNGELAFTWFDPDPNFEFDGVDLADGTVILTLSMKVIGSSGSAAVSITDNPASREVVNKDFCSNTVTAVNTSISLSPITVNCPEDLSVCASSLPLDLTSLGASPAGGTFSGTGVSGTDYTAAAGTTNTVTYTYTDINGCSNSCTFDITVYNQPAITCPGDQTVCESDLPLDLTALGALPGGGVFSGTGVSGTTYTAAGGTTNTVTYTITDGNGCTNSCTFDITVNALPAVNCPENQFVCVSALPLDLTTLGALPGGGTFSGTGVTGTNYTAASGTTNTITYTYTDGNNCSNSCTFDITVNAVPMVNCPENLTICVDNLPIDLTTLGALPGGGTFSGTGVTGTNYTAASGTTNTITYTYTDGNNCSNSCTFDITVNTISCCTDAIADAGDDQTVCFNTDAFLSGAINGGSNGTWDDGGAGGTFTPNANDLNATYTPPNNYSGDITLTLTPDAPGGTCTATSDALTLTVSPDQTLKLTAEGPAGPLTCGDLVSVTIKTTDFTDIGTLDFSVNWDAAELSLQGNTPLTIDGDAPVIGTPMANQLTFSWFDGDFAPYGADLADGTTILTLNFKVVSDMATGVNVDITGTPTALSASNSNFCEVTVTPMNMVEFDVQKISVTCPDDFAVCIEETPFALTDGIPGGGTFSGAGVTPPNMFDPATAGAGAHDITYTYTDANGCTNSCMFQITVNNQLVIDPIGNISVCPGAMVGAIPLAATPASNSTVFSWTGGASLGLVDGNDTGANPEIPAFMANAAITSATVTVTAVFGACMDDETFTVTLEDNEDPQITDCPDNQNLEGCNTDVITGLTYSEMDVTVTATQFAGAGGTASDNCGVALLAYKYKDSKSGACPITVSRVWTVTDLAGRTNQCTQTITIDDTQKPTITTCPQTRNIEGCNTDAITGPAYNESTTNSSYSVFSNATNGGVANDVCGIVSVTYKDSKSGTCPIVVSRTWTVTDACQNSTACVQTINVDDTQKPVITTCPQTRNIEGCNTGAITGPAYNESTTNSSYSVFSNATNGGVATDACGIVSVKYRDSKSGTCPIVVSRKWTVTDACDNSTDCIQTINVDDTQKPVITTCPQTRNIEGCNTDAITGPAYNESTTNSSYSVFSNATNGGVANDACGIVSVKYRDSKSGTCPIVVSRKWTVTDACDNSTDCIQTINVDDTELPDAYCQDATIVLGNDGTATLSPSDINDNSSDNCGIKNLSVSQSLFDCHHIGDNTVTLTVRDNCDNIATCQATVTVDQGNYLQMTPLPDISVCPATDVEAIELSGLPLNVVINYNWSGGAPAGMANGSATGADPEIPAFVATTNEGTWTVSVTANIFACVDEDEFTINVNDFNAPHFITCPADMIVNNDVDKCGANVNWLQPIAVDGCVDITEVGVYQVMPPGKESGSFFPIGMHTIKYVADDDNGNTTTCEFKVTVRDMQLPDIECPSGIQYLETNNGNCSHTLTGTYLNASVVENCGLDYVRNDYTNSPTLNGAVFPVGPWPIVVTWKAEDWSGNTATCTFAVIVVDNDAPTVASCPQDKTVSNDYGDCGAEVSYALPRFNDNCGGAYQPGTLIQGGSSGDFFNVGTTVVEWWYFDPSGNGPAVCNFTITVRDDEDPKITCPSNIVVEVDGSLSGGNGGAPSANPVLVGSGPCGVSLAYTAPVGTDNCAGCCYDAGERSWQRDELL